MYSRSAVKLWGNGEISIPSPNGASSIAVEHPERPDVEGTHTILHTLLIRTRGHVYKTKIGGIVNAEVAWSADSKAFFLTHSDAGLIGTYHVKVVYLTRSGIRVIEPVPDGSKLFSPTCFSPEVPNVGAISWVGNGSDRLAIAVQVPPHSSCASMGTFRAFVIQLPSGAVISQYNQIEAKKAFSRGLGSVLRNQDDSCIEEPQSCIPCGMKGGSCGGQ
jgi:hypothetical protein